MQHILVTGGAGRLGRLVVKHLCEAGYHVRGMSRRSNPGKDWPGAEWTQGDFVALVPSGLLLQPVDEDEVARRLCEIVQAGPSGCVPDMGGPQVYTSQELARIWLKQQGVRRVIIPLSLPGKMVRALRQGGNTCPQQSTGTVSWKAWLQQHERTRHLG